MEYIYSAMLLHSAGKPINEDGIANIMRAAGIEPDVARIKALTASLEGVNIKEAIESASVAAVSVGAPAKEEKRDEKKEKEERKEEKKVSEEDAAAGLGALFG